jgi:hypothetical protein
MMGAMRPLDDALRPFSIRVPEAALEDLPRAAGADPLAPRVTGNRVGARGTAGLPAGAGRASEAFYCDVLGFSVEARIGRFFVGVGLTEYRSLLVPVFASGGTAVRCGRGAAVG